MGTHLVVMTGVNYFRHVGKFGRSDKCCDVIDIILYISTATWVGFGWLFNFLTFNEQPIRFRIYFLYWIYFLYFGICYCCAFTVPLSRVSTCLL